MLARIETRSRTATSCRGLDDLVDYNDAVRIVFAIFIMVLGVGDHLCIRVAAFAFTSAAIRFG